MLCDDLGSGAGQGGSRGQDIGTLTAESRCCTAETNNVVKQLHSNLKNYKETNSNLKHHPLKKRSH